MKKIIVAAALVSTPVSAAVDELGRRLDSCAAEQARTQPFNGIALAGEGTQHWTFTSGAADTSARPITPQTQFRLASVGKVFTRIAIGQLIDAGKLSTADSVRKFLPELPPEFEPVTLSMLLEHRSGVASLTRITPDEGPTLASAQKARDVVQLLAQRGLEFPPGSKQSYSNGGYFLLGAVIEAVSGLSYRQYVEQHIFAPLKMSHSSFEPLPDAAVQMTLMAGPGMPPLANPQPRREMAAFKASPAGDTLSSAEDMGLLAQALIDNRLLSPAATVAVFPKTVTPWRLGQSGGSIGTNSDYRVLPDSKAWLVVLTNRDPPAGELFGRVVGGVLEGQACKPLSPGDVPSPFGPPPQARAPAKPERGSIS
jgi:CubicO group peptidase (beta-lactamase class C family)